MTTKQIENIIFQKARKYDLGYDFFREVIWEESHFEVQAVNPDSGAKGLGQLMPIVIEDFEQQTGIKYSDYMTPKNNLEVSAWYLGKRIPQMLQEYNHEVTRKNILWAYNAGIGNLNNGILPKETRHYFEKILPDVEPRGGIDPDLTIDVEKASDMDAVKAEVDNLLAEKPVKVNWEVNHDSGNLINDIVEFYKDNPEVQTILSVGEEIITQFVPFGKYIDVATDQINQYITKPNIMAKQKKNKKTLWGTVTAIIALVLGAVGISADPSFLSDGFQFGADLEMLIAFVGAIVGWAIKNLGQDEAAKGK